MNDYNFANKKIVILGLARQGAALARFFVRQGAQVTVSDAAPGEKLGREMAAIADLPVTLALGGHPLGLLDGCDLLCLSGGVPPQIEIVQAAIVREIPLSNDSLLTLQLARRRGLGPLVAITGSSGKTTTTTLVGKMLSAGGRVVHVGGNIGLPLIDRLDTIQPGQPLVLELSSFQLELFDPLLAYGDLAGVGPDVAAILNITPNHLDRHPSMAAYADAKFNLIRCLPPGAIAVMSADDLVTQRVAWPILPFADQPLMATWKMTGLLHDVRDVIEKLELTVRCFSREQRLASGAWLDGDELLYDGMFVCRRSEVKLPGDHNISNLLAAMVISGAAGATLDDMAETARAFTGVMHRLEVVADVGGVTWVNDSIATSPERAVAGLRSFDPSQQAIILLAGGKDKNLPWDAFAEEVLNRVSLLIGFGQAGPMIIEKVHEQANYSRRRAPSCAVVQRLDEAVELAARSAQPATVVLLSPGGTSYDAYRDFEERGEHFRRLAAQTSELCLRREA